MEELKLFSSGHSKHLEALKEKYTALKKKISTDNSLTEAEKNTELKQLEKSFEKEKKSTNNNLY